MKGKADIDGLYNLPYLLDQGILTGSLESHYVGYLSEALRSIRFWTGPNYGVIRSAAWNYFVEQGALTHDPATCRFSLNVEKMTQATEKLMATLLIIEAEGDTRRRRPSRTRHLRGTRSAGAARPGQRHRAGGVCAEVHPMRRCTAPRNN